jgi:hypothetical protein
MTDVVRVLDREVRLPVRVRHARSLMAGFPVPFAAARDLLAGTGIEPAPLPGGRTLCLLVGVDYVDGDLGRYGEVAVAFPVAERDDAPAGAYIHQLPVDGEFTLAAGRGIWGFPKWMAEIDLQLGPRGGRCLLAEDGELILDLEVRNRWLPLPERPADMTAWSNLDGTLRRTPFTGRARGVRGGPLGARLWLGERHPVARELRALGLPRRALFSSVVADMAATFGPAEELDQPPR